jgi:hypothetical protein
MCGRVQMRITQAPLITMACHCRGCQKLTGGAYSLSLMLPTASFEIEGETEIGALHRPDQPYVFCAYCKNWLYTSGIAGGQFVNMRPTLLDDASWIVPYVESYTSEKLPGVVSGAKHAYPKFPPPGDYPKLMEGFARDGARPA